MSILRQNKVFHNIFLMSATTVVAQSINIIAQPILTRLISAETLGIYTFLVSLANMAIPVASLKLDMLIVSEDSDDEAQYVTDLSIVIALGVSIIYFLVIFCAYFIGPNIFNKYGPIIFMVPVMVFTNGVRYLLVSYNNRYCQYKLIGVIGIVREVSRAVIQVISGLFQWGIIGQILGYACAPVFGIFRQTKDYRGKLKKRSFLSPKKMKEILGKGKNQILYLVPAQFLNNFSSALVIIFITSLYASETLGYYSAGVRLLEIPLIFIAANVSKVCYRQISEDVSLRKPTIKTILIVSEGLLGISLVGFGILYIIAPIFARFIFGPGYEVAGEYIRCLCLMYAIRLVVTSFAGLFTIFGKQKIEFYMVLFLVIAAIGIYLCCKFFKFPVTTFLWSISVAYSFLYSFIWFGYFLLCKRHDNSLIVNSGI